MVSGLPKNESLGLVALHGSVAYALTAGGRDSSVWKLTPNAPATKFVSPDPTDGARLSVPSIGAAQSGLVLTQVRCDDPPDGLECIRDSGMVKLYDRNGTAPATAELWNKKTTEPGEFPSYIGEFDGSVLVSGVNRLYEIDSDGKIVSTIPWAHGAVCIDDGDLYTVSLNGGLGDTSGELDIGPGDVAKLPPQQATMAKWTGSKWRKVAEGESGQLPATGRIECGNGPITAWSSKDDLAAVWNPSRGWRKVHLPSAGKTDSKEFSQQNEPVIADNGAIYEIDDAYQVLRFDLAKGKFLDTGLKLVPSTAKGAVSLKVAEQGPNLFACVEYRLAGLPGNESKEPGATCGFAPVPS